MSEPSAVSKNLIFCTPKSSNCGLWSQLVFLNCLLTCMFSVSAVIIVERHRHFHRELVIASILASIAIVAIILSTLYAWILWRRSRRLPRGKSAGLGSLFWAAAGRLALRFLNCSRTARLYIAQTPRGGSYWRRS